MIRLNYYKYLAKNNDGKIVKGKIDAPTERIAKKYLEGRNLQIVSIDEYQSVLKRMNEIEFGKVVKDQDILFFLGQLRSLLKAGLRISESLLLIANQTTNKRLRRILYSVFYEVENGHPLSKAMEPYKEFPKMIVKMIAIGEQTGSLLDVLEDVKVYFEKQKRMKKALVKTLKMPIIYLISSLLVTLAMLVFIFPVYSKAISNENAKVNWLTRMFQGASEFITKNVISFTNPSGQSSFYLRINGIITIDSSSINVVLVNWFNLLVFALVVTGLVLTYLLVRHKEEYKRLKSHIVLRTPVLGKILKLKYMSIFSSTIAELLKHRVDIILALELTKDIIPNYVYKDIIDKAIANVAKGESLALAFENHYAVEEVVPRMIIIGENSNNLEGMLMNISGYYNENVEDRFDSIREKLGPMIMLAIYILMGLLLIAMMLPTFYAIDGIK